MNTKFKRALSSVLAFIMLFSCVTVMNVSSVWAADVTAKWQPTADDTTSPKWVTLSGKASVTTASNSNIKFAYTESIGLDSINGAYGIVTGNSADTMTVKVRGNAKLKMWVYRNNSADTYFYQDKCNFENGSTDIIFDSETKYGNIPIKTGRTSESIEPITINLTTADSTKDSSYKFGWFNSAVVINRMELTYDDSLIVTAPCTLTCVSKADSNTSVTDFKVYDSKDAEVAAVDGKYTLTSGESYTVKATGYLDKTFSATGADETITLTPIFNVVITETNNVPFTVKNGSGTIEPVNGTYALTYGETYTISATDYDSKNITIENGDAITVTLAKSVVESFEYWFDGAGNATSGEHSESGHKIHLYSTFSKYDSNTYGKHAAYQGSPAKATLNGTEVATGSTNIADKGNAFAFKPGADGTLTIYSSFGAADKSYNLLYKDGDISLTGGTGVAVGSKVDINTEAGSSTDFTKAEYTFRVTKGNTYYICGNKSSGATAFYGIKFVMDNPVNVTFTTTGEALNGATLTATTATGTKVDIKTDGTATTLSADTEYTLSCSDITLLPTIDNKKTFTPTADTTALTITLTKDVNVTVEGDITGAAKGTNVTSLKFKNTSTNVEYKAVVDGTANTYKVELPKGDYKTVAETNNGSTTINRTKVTGAMTGEEVYFVAPSTITYNLPTEVNAASSALTFSGVSGNNPTSVNAGKGAKITVPVSGKCVVTVAGWHSGTWNINGQDEVTATSANGASNPATNSYTTNGTETSVTVNVTADGSTYLYWIKVAPATDYVETINVPDDYATVSAALEAIAAMPRQAGQTVTINLKADVEEQIHVTADNVIIKGNGHTISWYYGMLGSYYSMDSNGFYNEELFRDKYEKKPANGYYWGGVAIIEGKNFYAEDVTFKNTYNYTVTTKEKKDGAEFTSDHTLRETVGDVTKAAQKERAAAVILTAKADNAEFYKCNILSVQDTLGYNGALSNHAYFKNCTIGGNTDFICGAGSMVFDKCTLDIYKHSDVADVSGKIITAPKTSPYVFIDCEIKSNGAAGTGVFLGRPWDAKAPATFINTKTNGLVSTEGWTKMKAGKDASGNDVYNEPANALFKEYNNYGAATKDGVFNTTSTYDELTNTEYNSLVKGIVSTTLGGWAPKNYLPAFVSGIKTEKDTAGNYVIYAELSAKGVEALTDVGFTLSTVSPIFGQHEFTTGGKCYSAITFGEKTITPSEGNYLVGILLEAGVVNVNDTLHIRAFNDGTDRTYCEYASITVE